MALKETAGWETTALRLPAGWRQTAKNEDEIVRTRKVPLEFLARLVCAANAKYIDSPTKVPNFLIPNPALPKFLVFRTSSTAPSLILF